MNITYFIGNGFDLNLGYPTDYGHFYKYYCEQSSESEAVNLLKDDIKQYENNDWVDLEKGLGKYTSKITNAELFRDAYIDLNCHLSKYITAVDTVIRKSLSNELKEKITNDLIAPESYITEDIRNTIERDNNLPTLGGAPRVKTINILSFNYTLTIEYLNLLKGFTSRNTSAFDYKFGGIKHIHRTINDNGVWLGVDNANQISNESFRKDRLIRQLLIKPYDINSSNSGFFNTAKRIIDKSNLICIFGSSLGITDLTWWKIIGSHLNENDCRMIYFTIEEKGFVIDQLKLFSENSKRADMATLFSNDPNVRTVLDNPEKIIVPINTTIFRDRDYNKEIEIRYDEVLETIKNSSSK